MLEVVCGYVSWQDMCQKKESITFIIAGISLLPKNSPNCHPFRSANRSPGRRFLHCLQPSCIVNELILNMIGQSDNI